MRSNRWHPHVLVVALVALVALLVVTRADGGTVPVLAKASGDAAERQQAAYRHLLRDTIQHWRQQTWSCQDELGARHTRAERSIWALGPSNRYLSGWVVPHWKQQANLCARAIQRRERAVRNGRFDLLTTDQLYAEADKEVARGGIYGIGWGAASPLLKSLCYEAVDRAFGARAGWARFIVNRESGCNLAATNTTYSSWSQRAQCIAQLIPAYHTWVDYSRCKRDLRYSVYVFFRLSNGGANTGPWG